MDQETAYQSASSILRNVLRGLYYHRGDLKAAIAKCKKDEVKVPEELYEAYRDTKTKFNFVSYLQTELKHCIRSSYTLPADLASDICIVVGAEMADSENKSRELRNKHTHEVRRYEKLANTFDHIKMENV